MSIDLLCVYCYVSIVMCLFVVSIDLLCENLAWSRLAYYLGYIYIFFIFYFVILNVLNVNRVLNK